MELNLGVLLELKTKNATQYRFQNFKVSNDVSHEGHAWLFAPFSFNGAISNLKGENLDAGLIFPSTKIIRAWASEALTNQWMGVARVMLLNDDSTVNNQLYSYTGVIAAGGWDTNTVELSLNTIVDAVRGEVPGRRMNAQLVGNIPITANIRV